MFSYLQHLLHLIYPRLCCACKQYEPLEGSIFCAKCKRKLPFISSPADAEASLIGKEAFPSDISYIHALFYYTKDSSIAQMMHDIKYKGQYRKARSLGALLGHRITDDKDWSQHIIVPVPIHPKRRRSRGFNQAEEISKGLASVLKCEIEPDFLIRTRYETSQTAKDKYERSDVLQASFNLNVSLEAIPKIMLVDDVITTGSTINACVHALRQKPHADINVLALGISI